MQLHWQSLGNGPRRATALHCSLASHRAWRGLAAALEGRVVLDACDLPGHGASPDWPKEGRDYQGTAARAVIDRLAGPTDLIGHSFGGTVALRVAVMRPDLVRSLTLIEPVMFAAAFASDPHAEALHDRIFAPFADAWAKGDRDGAARAFTRVWGAGTQWEDMPETQRAQLAARIHLIPAGGDGILADAGGIVPALAGLTMPTHLIEGAQSPAIVARIQAALAERMPFTQRTVIEGAGHMLPITHPGALAAQLTL